MLVAESMLSNNSARAESPLSFGVFGSNSFVSSNSGSISCHHILLMAMCKGVVCIWGMEMGGESENQNVSKD